MAKAPIHTPKFEKCVKDVQAKGHSKSSAFAICTTQFKKTGEPIFKKGEGGRT